MFFFPLPKFIPVTSEESLTYFPSLYKLETDFQNSLFTQLEEMTEVLGPFDPRQSVRCREL